MNIYLVKPIDTPTRNMICVAEGEVEAKLMHPENKVAIMEVFLLGTAIEEYTKPMMISYQKD